MIVKVALVADAATTTEDGAVRLELWLDMDTVIPPAEAGLLRVTVQTSTESGPKLEELQASDEIKAGAVRTIAVVADVVPTVAVIVAVSSFVITFVVAVNTPVKEPTLTITEVGAERRELLLERLTAAPPSGAGVDRVTVQLVEAVGPRLAWPQDTEEIPIGAIRLRSVETDVPLRMAVIFTI